MWMLDAVGVAQLCLRKDEVSYPRLSLPLWVLRMEPQV